MAKHRSCCACGCDLYRKWTWSEWAPEGRKTPTRWLCMTCGQTYLFRLDGSLLNRIAAYNEKIAAERAGK